MVIPPFRSRPDYTAVRPPPHVRLHIIACQQAGAPATSRAFAPLLEDAQSAATASADGRAPSASIVWLVLADAATDREVPPSGALQFHDMPTLLAALATRLAGACMSTRLHAVGDESFTSAVLKVGLTGGLAGDAIQLAHVGARTRRVQCVHCKTIMDDVTASPVRCVCCGEALLVRDHYSRRLGAYMGVSIDAEAPGTAPPPAPLPPVPVLEPA